MRIPAFVIVLAALLLVAGAAFVAGQSQPEAIEVLPDGSVVINGRLIVQGNAVVSVPVGSVIAWHKALAPGLTLPAGFVQCDGQVLNDPQSPFHNRVVPDLNGATAGTSRFIRGATDATVGQVQEDAFQGHWHASAVRQIKEGGGGATYYNGWSAGSGNNLGYQDSGVTHPTNDGANGDPRTASETRPKNIALVWIMRIK